MSYSPNIVVSMLFSNLFSIRFSTNRKQVPEKPGVFRFVQVPLSCQARSDINASTLAGAVGWCGGGVMTFITTFPIPVMDVFPAPILGLHDAVGRLNKCKCRKNTSKSSRNSSFRSPRTHGWRMGGSRFFAVPDKQRSFFSAHIASACYSFGVCCCSAKRFGELYINFGMRTMPGRV